MTKGAAKVIFPKATVREVPISGKTVLLRVDYNVPLEADGTIADDLRIRASLPTIEYLIDQKCKVVIISHLGRPKGRDVKFSLEPMALRLAQLLKKNVRFVDQTAGDKPYQAVKRAPKNSVIVLENLRFDKGEEENNEEFARKIVKASGASYFVQDGFGIAHRAHASTSAITMLLPSVAGLLMEDEYLMIMSAIQHPKKPLVAVIGGAKVSDKIGILKKFISVADKIIVAGAMANTFLAYKGLHMGASKLETDKKGILDAIYNLANEKTGDADDFLLLPVDLAVAQNTEPSARRRVVGVDNLTSNDMALDIGSRSIEAMVSEVKKAGTVVWNGPLGVAELPAFAHGSARLALALASQPETVSIIGGGDTADFVLGWGSGSDKNFTHISTGGGASITLMEGEKLPGLESLLDAKG